jgi:hypothetical protein
MAHRIYKNDKQQGTTMGWHGLTEICPEISLGSNWLRQWETVETPLFFDGGAASPFRVLRCSDIPDVTIGLPYNPDTFRPVSNSAFLQLIQDSISGTSHKVVSVGSVRNRGRVFVSIELVGREMFTAAGRKFSAFLNFGNGHDKSSVLCVNTSNTCTVCDNTFSANLFTVEDKNASKGSQTDDDLKFRLRHCKNVAMRFPALANLIDKAIGVQGEFAATLDALALQPIALPVVEPLFAGFIGRNIVKADLDKGLSVRARNTVTRLTGLFQSGAGNRGENLADAFSAVTDYYTHESSGGDDKNRQFLSSEYGAGQIAKADFWRGIQDSESRSNFIDRGEVLLAAKGATVQP